MSDRDGIILRKMIKYTEEALSYTRGLDFAGFSQNSIVVNATAFVLGQLGELTKQVSQETQDANPHIYWSGIRGLRNRIVHDYENLDMNRFWDVVCDDLPELDTLLKKMLELD